MDKHYENPKIIGYEKTLNGSFTIEGDGIFDVWTQFRIWVDGLSTKEDIRIKSARCDYSANPAYIPDVKKEDKKQIREENKQSAQKS